jgi:hypothetical protein
MLGTVPYTREELLRERREGAVRALIRVVGYALTQGHAAEAVGRFLFDSYRLGGEFQRQKATGAALPAFAAWHVNQRWGWCEEVTLRSDKGGVVIESGSILQGQAAVLGFHGVTRLDMEACMETFWRLSGAELGFAVTYTIGDVRDWAVIRTQDGGTVPLHQLTLPAFDPDGLASHRRIALATGITSAIGFAKQTGAEPEALGQFFYQVWDRSGHYDRLRARWGYGNALAYAQNMAKARQLLYTQTTLAEDLDGYTITSPSWATEIPQIMGTFGCLPDDVYRYYEGGGIPACARLGLQYADQSEARVHRVWIRSR